jgi:tetratricopeptide (TPR) repeat protein
MNGRDEPSYRSALAAFDEAARLDSRYARPQAMRAYVLMFLAAFGTATDRTPVRDTLLQALDAANRAVSLAPGWGESYAARGAILLALLDFAGAEHELLRARSLAPGDIGVDRPYAYLEAWLGHPAAAEAAAARVVARYPAEGSGYWDQAQIYYLDRHYREALAASQHGSALVATGPAGGDEATSALAWLALGRPDMAASICTPNKTWQETMCLAIVEQRLGHIARAQTRLAALRALLGDRGAYNYAQIYAQWGAPENALAWLGTAYRLHDTGIVQLKVDPLMDPIRARPEFADIERRLNFPQ